MTPTDYLLDTAPFTGWHRPSRPPRRWRKVVEAGSKDEVWTKLLAMELPSGDLDVRAEGDEPIV